MKLLRFGPKGAEKPGILDSQGQVRDLSGRVPDLAGEDYAIIEANERPGLANHEPQPTAQRFVDLLFPHSRIEP